MWLSNTLRTTLLLGDISGLLLAPAAITNVGVDWFSGRAVRPVARALRKIGNNAGGIASPVRSTARHHVISPPLSTEVLAGLFKMRQRAEDCVQGLERPAIRAVPRRELIHHGSAWRAL